MGGYCLNTYIVWFYRFRQHQLAPPIHVIEGLADLVQISLNSGELQGERYLVHLDNQSALDSLRSTRGVKDPKLNVLTLIRNHTVDPNAARPEERGARYLASEELARRKWSREPRRVQKEAGSLSSSTGTSSRPKIRNVRDLASEELTRRKRPGQLKRAQKTGNSCVRSFAGSTLLGTSLNEAECARLLAKGRKTKYTRFSPGHISETKASNEQVESVSGSFRNQRRDIGV